jgi:hypothetical protein
LSATLIHRGRKAKSNPRVVRRDPLRDLVGIVCRRQPGADVEELPDSRLGGQESDGPAEKGAVGFHPADHAGCATLVSNSTQKS